MQRQYSVISSSPASDRARDPIKQISRDIRRVRDEQESTTRLLEKIVVPFIKLSEQRHTKLENRVLQLEQARVWEDEERERYRNVQKSRVGRGRDGHHSENQRSNVTAPSRRRTGGRNERPFPYTINVPKSWVGRGGDGHLSENQRIATPSSLSANQRSNNVTAPSRRGTGGRNGRPFPYTMIVDGKERYICGICSKDYAPSYYWRHYNSH